MVSVAKSEPTRPEPNPQRLTESAPQTTSEESSIRLVDRALATQSAAGNSPRQSISPGDLLDDNISELIVQIDEIPLYNEAPSPSSEGTVYAAQTTIENTMGKLKAMRESLKQVTEGINERLEFGPPLSEAEMTELERANVRYYRAVEQATSELSKLAMGAMEKLADEAELDDLQEGDDLVAKLLGLTQFVLSFNPTSAASVPNLANKIWKEFSDDFQASNPGAPPPERTGNLATQLQNGAEFMDAFGSFQAAVEAAGVQNRSLLSDANAGMTDVYERAETELNAVGILAWRQAEGPGREEKVGGTFGPGPDPWYHYANDLIVKDRMEELGYEAIPRFREGAGGDINQSNYSYANASDPDATPSVGLSHMLRSGTQGPYNVAGLDDAQWSPKRWENTVLPRDPREPDDQSGGFNLLQIVLGPLLAFIQSLLGPFFPLPPSSEADEA